MASLDNSKTIREKIIRDVLERVTENKAPSNKNYLVIKSKEIISKVVAKILAEKKIQDAIDALTLDMAGAKLGPSENSPSVYDDEIAEIANMVTKLRIGPSKGGKRKTQKRRKTIRRRAN